MTNFVWVTIVRLSHIIQHEIEDGTLEVVLSSPTRMSAYLVGQSFRGLLLGGIFFVASMLVGTTFFETSLRTDMFSLLSALPCFSFRCARQGSEPASTRICHSEMTLFSTHESGTSDAPGFLQPAHTKRSGPPVRTTDSALSPLAENSLPIFRQCIGLPVLRQQISEKARAFIGTTFS